MNRKMLFPILAVGVSGLLFAGSTLLAQRAQPVHALSQRTGPTVSAWRQVNIDGFGDGNNREAIRLAVHDDHLFVSTENLATGGEVWRSANGTTWDQVNADGFGVISTTIAFAEGSFNGYLYVGTGNNATGAEIWRCITCVGSDWTRVVSNGFGDINNHIVQRVMLFSNTFYAIADNGVTGVEVWKSPTGAADSWTQSNADGFGNPQNTGAWAAAVFDGYLYVATAMAGDWTPPDAFGVEVWRTDGSDSWVKVTPAGFGGRENVAWDLAQAGGKLYLSLGNFSGAQVWRCVICDGSDWAHVVDGSFGTNALATVVFEYQHKLIAVTSNNWEIGEDGTGVWISEDGVHWAQASSGGFGDPHNVKVGTGGITEYKGLLYLGTQNDSTGAELWQSLKQVYLPLVVR